MPFSGNKWEMQKMVPYDRMVETIRNVYPEFHRMKNEPNDTSKVSAYTTKIVLDFQNSTKKTFKIKTYLIKKLSH